MKRYRSFTQNISQYLSGERAPGKKGLFIFVTAIVSALSFFMPEAIAQRVSLAVSLVMAPPTPVDSTTNPFSLVRPANTVRFICGVVLDTTGVPLPGATLRLFPTSEALGTATGIEGEFTLKIPPSYIKDSLSLRISLVGFITQVHRLSQFQQNDHIEICMAVDQRHIGCPPVMPVKQENVHRINQDLINKPALIKYSL